MFPTQVKPQRHYPSFPTTLAEPPQRDGDRPGPDGDIKVQWLTARAPTFLFEPTNGFRSANHIRIGFHWLSNHEIEHKAVAPSLLMGYFDASQEYFVRKALIDDV